MILESQGELIFLDETEIWDEREGSIPFSNLFVLPDRLWKLTEKVKSLKLYAEYEYIKAFANKLAKNSDKNVNQLLSSLICNPRMYKPVRYEITQSRYKGKYETAITYIPLPNRVETIKHPEFGDAHITDLIMLEFYNGSIRYHNKSKQVPIGTMIIPLCYGNGRNVYIHDCRHAAAYSDVIKIQPMAMIEILLDVVVISLANQIASDTSAMPVFGKKGLAKLDDKHIVVNEETGEIELVSLDDQKGK